MYFSPNKREMRNEGADEDDKISAVEGTIIKKVTETKFLGVTILHYFIQSKFEDHEIPSLT